MHATGMGNSPSPEFDLADLMGEAGWAEADRALVKALSDLSTLEKAFETARRKRFGEKVRPQDMDDALALLRQSLAQVARRRGLHRYGEVGAIEAYRENLHELTVDTEEKPTFVEILAQGLARGDGPGADVIQRAMAAPARSRSGLGGASR